MIYNINVSIFRCRFSDAEKNFFKEDSLMSTTVKMKIGISNSNARILGIESSDECVELILEVDTAQEQSVNTEDGFVLVEASKLSLDDNFFCRYDPKTTAEKRFKESLEEVIRNGVKDFYLPNMDPSFADANTIHYVAGEGPAVGKSYNWWTKAAKEFMPDRGSRLGTKSEYIAFLAVLIKVLVQNGWSTKKAWNAVCNNSKEIGHYWDSVEAKGTFEKTGSREIYGFFDLGNTCKILSADKNCDAFVVTGGYYNCNGGSDPLFKMELLHNCYFSNNVGVGWIVLEN